MARITFAKAQSELREQGVSLTRTAVPGEFRVALSGQPARTAQGYYTDDLEDAVGTGRAMAAEHLRRLHQRAGGVQHFDTAMRLAEATNRL